MVGKLLAGIEDGVDNGWSLIRADAGSLLFFFSLIFSLSASAVRLELSLDEPIGRRYSGILLELAWARR